MPAQVAQLLDDVQSSPLPIRDGENSFWATISEGLPNSANLHSQNGIFPQGLPRGVGLHVSTHVLVGVRLCSIFENLARAEQVLPRGTLQTA